MLEVLNVIFAHYNVNLSEIFIDNWFLISIGIFWLIFASIQDIRRREVENWWSFSLIALVLGYRAFFSIEKGEYMYFVWGLIGFVVGFILMELFYYARMFAGGDAKLLLALSCIIPLSLDWKINIFLFVIFIISFLFSGAIYGFLYSFGLAIFRFKEFKKNFLKSFQAYRRYVLLSFILGIVIFFIFYFIEVYMAVSLGLLIFVSSILFIYGKAIEDSCMNKLVSVKELTIGDWLVEPIKIGKKTIRPYWEGLSEEELKLIQKSYKKQVNVKYGIPFVPAFLLSFIIMLLMSLF